MHLETKDYAFSGGVARYLTDRDTGAVSLVLLPDNRPDCYVQRRAMLGVPELVRIGMDPPAWQVGSLVHLSLRGDAQGNGAGCTLKYGASVRAMRLASQTRTGDTVTTRLQADGWHVEHSLTWTGRCWQIETVFCNDSPHPLTLDLLTSFSLDNLSPFGTAAEKRLRLHRFRGGWSMEGMHTAEDIQELNLATPWTYAFPESERFGGIGSHPVKRYFPVCAVEDPDAGVFWGACVAAAGSWQMEFSRDSDCYSLSGGLADAEFGSWQRTVQPGERFAAPRAWAAAGSSLDEVCRALTGIYEAPLKSQPASEQSLPVVFNEWCTTWGNPSHERMLALADRLAGTPVKYIVIDAGWTNVIPHSFGQGGNGDWEYSRERFPGGLVATSRALREKGFVTGIWFEFEVTTEGARVFGHEYDEMHLHRGGEVIVTGAGRSFWDFRRPDVIAYLREKVLDFLRDNEIGYLKVDYNGSIGVGCDGGCSAGDGLQQQMEAVLGFFDLLRRELPELVIESCASGGHRLTAPFLQRCAMASFSDAHECLEIPVLAARLHRLMLPRQMQIWAVINPDQSRREMVYRLASGFLGRLCLSGALDELDGEQLALVRQAAGFYERCSGVIRTGETTVYGEGSRWLRALTGWQAAVRVNGSEALAVVHVFDHPAGGIRLPLRGWQIAESLCEGVQAKAGPDGLVLHTDGGHCAGVFRLVCVNSK